MRLTLTTGWCLALAFLLALSLAHFAVPGNAYVTSFPEEPDIDGNLISVGLVIAKWLSGLLPYPGISALIDAILEAWTPKPEDDYWENVKDKVEELCGQYVNELNIRQVEVYKDDLMGLMKKYQQAPVESDGTYPDKNLMADAITTSVITNRYLIEASEMPWSLTLHFGDISSVHIMILKDVAESYTSDVTSVSRWWVDLSRELEHYTKYGRRLQQETLLWRQSQIECHFVEASAGCLAFEWMQDCFDEYVIKDHVSNYEEDCDQLHPDTPAEGSCVAFCPNYEVQLTRQINEWQYQSLGILVQEWETLKLLADQMAAQATKYYNPRNMDQYTLINSVVN